jgi:hypothetical protein
MSAHAMEEMAEDGLDIEDVEQAILNGRIARIERDDPRGTKYVVEGSGADGWTHDVYILDSRTNRGRRLRLVFQDKGNGLARVFTGWDLKRKKRGKR